MVKKTAWISQKQAYQQSINYISERKKGTIKSIKTPWDKFNDATVDGFEWHSMIVLAGRPGTGKTLIKDQFIREVFDLNPLIKFNVLEFQFEMVGQTSAIRQYSAVLGKTYKQICSADGILSDEDLQRCFDYAKKRINYPIDIVEEPCTVNEIRETVEAYMERDAYMEEVEDKKTGEKTKVKKYVPAIITLDHSVLVKKTAFEKDKMDTLYNLGECLTELKRKYPIIFIILSQLNRNVDSPERNEEGRYGNYIVDSDIFGADALLQHADTVVAFNRPGAKKLRYYGTDRFIIENDRILAAHFLKARNGDTRLSFFEAQFERMCIVEIPTPPQQQRKTNYP